jgi:hypothetical protein
MPWGDPVEYENEIRVDRRVARWLLASRKSGSAGPAFGYGAAVTIGTRLNGGR